MFWPDVLDYNRFYASHLGVMVANAISRRVAKIWPDAHSHAIIGLGYALPAMHGMIENRRSFAFMPTQQGVIHWPHSQPNRTILTDDYELPLANQSVDRVIMTHMLEHSATPQQLLEEAWRVLTPGGRLLVLVPNRRSIWATLDSTPFGHGRPFSLRQLKNIMEESRFTQTRSGRMLFFPPSNNRLIMRYAAFIEKICCNVHFPFGGLLWMEAEKQVYAIRKVEAKVRKFRPVALPAIEGALRSE